MKKKKKRKRKKKQFAELLLPNNKAFTLTCKMDVKMHKSSRYLLCPNKVLRRHTEEMMELLKQ